MTGTPAQKIAILCALVKRYRDRLEAQQSTPKRQRKPRTASVVRQATRAGLTVSAVTVTAEGVRVDVGSLSESASDNPLDCWLAKRNGDARSS